tara:strand:+ start:5047 stop:5316 length:270 start_codon:yes stop_codon:yes gene_type:complete
MKRGKNLSEQSDRQIQEAETRQTGQYTTNAVNNMSAEYLPKSGQYRENRQYEEQDCEDARRLFNGPKRHRSVLIKYLPHALSLRLLVSG